MKGKKNRVQTSGINQRTRHHKKSCQGDMAAGIQSDTLRRAA